MEILKEFIPAIILCLISFGLWLINILLDKRDDDSVNKGLDVSKTYGKVTDNNDTSDTKTNNIKKLINEGETDIKIISNKSNCTYPECVLKIRHLIASKQIEHFYLDTVNFKLFKCSREDAELLAKYKTSIYSKHLSIDEIATSLYNIDPYSNTKEEYKDQVFNDLKYLYDKKVLFNVKLNPVDRTIKYYLDQNGDDDLVTVHCPNCGALNEVDVDSKVRCSYCNTIIVADKTE